MLNLTQAFKGIILTIKDIKSLLTFFGITGAGVLNYSDEILTFFYTYAHLFYIGSIFLLIIYIELTKKVMVNKYLEQSIKISEVEKNQRIRDLKARVDSAYKEYGGDKINDRWVIAGLLELKKELDELSVNSYTQGKLESMIDNIEYE